ncbi:MAG TPA: hypothetical protein VMX97_05390 [Hyphomicrobiaceae bacterium]|nr:hypothetical protein [Hyphomicrobiaceae bacterium]
MAKITENYRLQSFSTKSAHTAANADSRGTPDLFFVPETPVQPRIVASEDTEKALGLKRT